MKDIDFERASLLLDIIQKVVAVGPQNQQLLGEAQAELKEINDAAYENSLERGQERMVEETKRQQAEQAKLRAEQPPLPNAEVVEEDVNEPEPKPTPTIPRRT